MSKWQVGSTITVNDLMQRGYTDTLLEPTGRTSLQNGLKHP